MMAVCVSRVGGVSLLRPGGWPAEDVEAPARALTTGDALARADAERLAGLLRVVSDPTRLQLLSMILSAPAAEACVTDLTSPLELTQPTVSHHLRVMVDAGLLQRERRGKQVWFSIVPERLAAIGDILR